jgi:CheY-like chemotaxis protein
MSCARGARQTFAFEELCLPRAAAKFLGVAKSTRGMNRRIYRLTEAGRNAWESQDAAVPADYRRLLWMMDFHGHRGLLGQLARTYPREVLDEWLAELEELALIEQVPPSEESKDHFTAQSSDDTLGLEDATVHEQARAAGAVMASTGAYVAAERIGRRPPLAKPRAETEILIVEDDPDQLALADLRVSMAGYKVRVARSANDFLQTMFDDGAPDLLVLDIQLPDGDGFEILARMRRHRALSGLPIIMLTARAEPEMIGKGLVLGADAYVTKPYTKRLLADTIAAVLRQG